MKEIAEALIEKMVNDVLAKFQTEIRSKFLKSEDFNVAMTLMKTQLIYQEGYGGFTPPQLRGSWVFAGGMDEYVVSNMMCVLGLHSESSGSKQAGFDELIKLNPIIMAEAMRRDKDLMIFVRSAVIGAIKRTKNFTKPREQQLLNDLRDQLKDEFNLSPECNFLADEEKTKQKGE